MAHSPPDAIALDTRVAATSSQITSQLGDESVILSIDDGMYYGLDSIGTRVWAMLDQPRTVREVCAAIERDYDVEPADCHAAVIALMRDLAGRGLVAIQQ